MNVLGQYLYLDDLKVYTENTTGVFFGERKYILNDKEETGRWKQER